MNTEQDGDTDGAGPAWGTPSISSLDSFRIAVFLQISAAAESAVMKRAGDDHLYALYVLLRIRVQKWSNYKDHRQLMKFPSTKTQDC